MRYAYRGLAALLLAVMAAGCGSNVPQASLATAKSLVSRMLTLRTAAVPFSSVPAKTRRLSGIEQSQLLQQEKKALAALYTIHATGYRQNLSLYERALMDVSKERRLSPDVSHIHVVSITQNGSSASVEWTAILSYRSVTRNASSGSWSAPVPHQDRVVGTTILQSQAQTWRISSTAGSQIS